MKNTEIDEKEFELFRNFIDMSNEELKKELFVDLVYLNIKDYFENTIGVSLEYVLKNYNDLIRNAKINNYSLDYVAPTKGYQYFGQEEKLVYSSTEITIFHNDVTKSHPDWITEERDKMFQTLTKLGFIERMEVLKNNFDKVKENIEIGLKEVEKNIKKAKETPDEEKYNYKLTRYITINEMYNSLLNIKNFYVTNTKQFSRKKLEVLEKGEFVKLMEYYGGKYSSATALIQKLIYLLDLKNNNNTIFDYKKTINEFISYLKRTDISSDILKFNNFEFDHKQLLTQKVRKQFIKDNENHPVFKMFGNLKMLEGEENEKIIQRKNELKEKISRTDLYIEKYKKENNNEFLQRAINYKDNLLQELKETDNINQDFEKFVHLDFEYLSYMNIIETIETILENNSVDFNIENIKNGKIKDLQLFNQQINRLYQTEYKEKYKSLEEFKIYLFDLSNKALEIEVEKEIMKNDILFNMNTDPELVGDFNKDYNELEIVTWDEVINNLPLVNSIIEGCKSDIKMTQDELNSKDYYESFRKQDENLVEILNKQVEFLKQELEGKQFNQKDMSENINKTNKLVEVKEEITYHQMPLL